ncbi:MarR family winged helix-turn-helix transcriptional regulator [Neomoorella mulderi]|uniref:Transcriptional repressor MprA n=1 Tax=Moorella mulderi DSM 14980 TaxID=1122241 RepID=A0A151B0Z6_9FIRM|nr:MarR family transcriptional regulator [Moorella mulderi]KYH33568.1 transcriptional repressor MprA [Moorella mulderi DSM 14980]
MQEILLLELFSRVYRRLVRRLAPLFQAEGFSGTEILVLWKVHKKGSLRATELAGHIGIPPSTFTGIFDRLVARGLLKRVPDPEDRRSVLVRGTPALKDFMGRFTVAVENELRSIFKSLPAESSRRILADLQLILQYLDREEGDGCGRVQKETN